jgi:L-ascorbate metabolism protein UlaG (beta-lactamase superfamily)
VHIDPAEAVQAFLDVGAKRAIGMHFGTFQLTAEAIGAPALELTAALTAKYLVGDDFIVLDVGASTSL